MGGLKPNLSLKRKLMQYLRWIPANLGLINQGAYQLQIKNIYADDIFLVSYPKSGNTWLRYIVAYILHPDKDQISLDS